MKRVLAAKAVGNNWTWDGQEYAEGSDKNTVDKNAK